MEYFSSETVTRAFGYRVIAGSMPENNFCSSNQSNIPTFCQASKRTPLTDITSKNKEVKSVHHHIKHEQIIREVESLESSENTLSNEVKKFYTRTNYTLEQIHRVDTYELYSKMLLQQSDMKPKVTCYLSRLMGIDEDMRRILMDWMCDVVKAYDMDPETFFMAVSMVDRYLSVSYMESSQFQLLGTAALFLSSKFNEIYPPPTEEFSAVTDRSFSESDVVKMEKHLFRLLDHRIHLPNLITFSYFYSHILNIKSSLLHMEILNSLCEIVSLSYNLSSTYTYSVQALSVVICLLDLHPNYASKMYNHPEWWKDCTMEVKYCVCEILSDLDFVHTNDQHLNVYLRFQKLRFSPCKMKVNKFLDSLI